ESDKDALLDQVLSKSSSQGRKGSSSQVISVVGVGGSGKTTLAQLLFNDDRKRIARAILESLEKSSLGSLELEPLLQLLKETFSGKRFLLVLDDVWTEDDSKWEPFQNSLKDGAPGSVILVTTRSHRVAAVVGTTHTHQMALMSDSDCWLIMQRIAFGGRSEEWRKKRESIGQKIAEKCKGLPLAAKTMGSLLRLKDTVQQWQNVLDSEIWQLEEELSPEQKLFPHLYLSYNELSPELKRCFSYCAVFPKDHSIVVEELIWLWMAQGYVRPRRRGESLELVGREYFDNLAMRSFFQELQKATIYRRMTCKMHDIVHDFAQFLTKNECHALDGTGRNSSSERPRHLTILEVGTEDVDFGRLRSFLTFSEIGRVVVPQNLFSRLKCVRTLTLSDCGLDEIPAEIGRLIHLRLLDLKRNPFVALPEAICDLYYLETLDISFCDKLSSLPEKIEGLVHLRHLFNYEYTDDLRQIPQGLGKLTSLCTLSGFIARSNSDDLAILKDLNQLENLVIKIKGEVDFGKTPSCIETMQPPPNLELLALVGYPGAQLPSWLVTKSHANNLTKLVIGRPHNISSLLALRKLSSLEELKLVEVGKLECLGKEFFGSSSSAEAVAFPNLRKLHFDACNNWTNWEDLSEDDEEVAVSIMPSLEKLKISKCYRLEVLPHRILSKILSLKILDIRSCDKLRDHYSDKTGDDWKQISHIPQVDISDKW
ncbi:unnamed protein product, partial [Coffea canephora]